MYYQVPEESGNSQPIIGNRSFKVGVALITTSCLVFMLIVASPVSFPLLHGTTAAQATSLASMPSTVRFPQVAKGVRPAAGFLRFPQIAKRRSSVLPMGTGSVEASAPALDAAFQEAPVTTKATPRRSMLKTVAAAALSSLLANPSVAADTVAVEQLPPKIKMLQMISSWDTNKDGRIDRPEFDAGMTAYVPHELTPSQLDNSWNKIVNVEMDKRRNDPSYAGNILTPEQKQLPQPGQQLRLPTDRVESSIPKASGGMYQYPSPQQAYNAMLRKGKDPDIYRARDFVATHNEMNERGWDQVLKYERVTHPECPSNGVKLKKFNGDYAGRVEGSFDRHHWKVDRCGKEEVTYVLDYYDTNKKTNDGVTMPYSNDDIEIRVKPDPDDPNAKVDTATYEKAVGKDFSSTADKVPFLLQSPLLGQGLR